MTALITGASSGLGVHFAELFAKDGYDLILVARSEDKLNNLKDCLEERYGVKTVVCVKDLSLPNAAQEVFAFVQEQGMEVDALVNNAGFADFGAYANADWKRQQDMVQVNITALIQLTHCFLKPMIARGSGRIMNVASMAAFQPGPLMSVYYATKSFVLSFTEALSVELRGTGVKVTALCPGPTETGFAKNGHLGNSGLFKNLSVASALEVAAYGYMKLKQGQTVAIPGMMNKLIVTASKYAPRAMARNLVYLIQKEK